MRGYAQLDPARAAFLCSDDESQNTGPGSGSFDWPYGNGWRILIVAWAVCAKRFASPWRICEVFDSACGCRYLNARDRHTGLLAPMAELQTGVFAASYDT
eukprot:gene9432-5300_t